MDPQAQSAAIERTLLGEAADWMVRFRSGETSEADRDAFQRWRSQSAAHEAAWQRAESVFQAFGSVPADLARGTISRLGRRGRRRALQTLGALAVAAPASWLALHEQPWKEWTADLRTATGEQRAIDLEDGTRLVLNTATAVDIVFTQHERRLALLAGEILVTTGPDAASAHRPFIVQTPQGTVRALGTRFSVRRLDGATRVAVFQDAVEIHPSRAEVVILREGSETVFSADGAQRPVAVDAPAALWEQGMLVAKHMRLADLAAELSRYRPGVVRCHPDAAGITVSGAFPLRDTDASLALLEKTLPLRIGRLSRYWVTIEPI